MNQLFAKIPSGKSQSIFKLNSGQEFFLPIELSEDCLIPYEANHNLDKECWFIITNFSTKPFFPDFLKQDIVSADYNLMPKDKIGKILFIFSTQKDEVYFQRITPARFIRRTFFFDFSSSFEIRNLEHGFLLNKQADAFYSKKIDSLIFKSLEKISPIFNGIANLYREATKEEIDKFLKSPFLLLKEGYNSEKVGKNNRKRIAMAVDKLKSLSESEKLDLFHYTAKYYKKAVINEGNIHFEIAGEGDLKHLLYGMFEKYYTTPVSNEKRIANSTQSLN